MMEIMLTDGTYVHSLRYTAVISPCFVSDIDMYGNIDNTHPLQHNDIMHIHTFIVPICVH